MDNPVVTTRKRPEEKKGGGFLASLLSKLGLGGGPVANQAATSSVTLVKGAAASSGLWGGVLATKAGITALVLAGTTVAGGLVLMGPDVGKLLMPSSGGGVDRLESGPFPVAQKTNAEEAAQPGPANGASQSLSYVAQANSAPPQAPAAPAQPVSMAPSAPVPNNSNSPANVGSSAPHAKMVSAPSLSGSGGGSSAGSFSGGQLARMQSIGDTSGLGNFQSVYKSATSGFTTGSHAAVGSSRALPTGTGGNGAMGQARNANGVVRGNLSGGNTSSQGSGTTYDGGVRAGSTINGPAGIADGGLGTGGKGVNSDGKANPNPAPNQSEPPAPPKATGSNQSKWQGFLFGAIGAIILSIALIILAGKAALGNWFGMGLTIGRWLAGLALAAAAVATLLGILIATKYGQPVIGGMLAAIGALLSIWAGATLYDPTAGEKSKVGAAGASQQAATTAQGSLSTAQTAAPKAMLLPTYTPPTPPPPGSSLV